MKIRLTVSNLEAVVAVLVVLALGVLLLVVISRQRRKFARDLAMLVADVALAEEVAGLGYWRRVMGSDEAWWSGGMYRLFGLDPVQFRPLVKNISARFHPDDWSAVTRLTDPAATGGKGGNAEARIFCGDGSIKDVLVATRYRTARSGEVEEVFGIIADITARKAAMRISALREEQMRRAVDAMAAAVWEFDL